MAYFTLYAILETGRYLELDMDLISHLIDTFAMACILVQWIPCSTSCLVSTHGCETLLSHVGDVNSAFVCPCPMQISYIEKRSIDNLRISTLIEDRIFFMRGNQLVSKSIYSYDTENLPHQTFKERVDYICSFNGFILILCGNVLHKYRLFGNELVLSHSYQLREPPLKVFLCGTPRVKESYAVCFLYRGKQIEIFTDSVEGITVCCKGEVVREDDIIDFFVTDTSAWFLSKSGNVYHSHSFVLTRTVLLSKPMKMLPEPTNFNGDACGILAKKDRLYISYRDGFEVYEICKSILVLVYTYKTSNFELFVFGNVFCAEENLLVVDDAPKVVTDIKIQKLFGNIGVSFDKIVFIREEGALERKGVKLLKEEDSEVRVEEMFGVLDTNFKVRDFPCTEEKMNGKVSEKTFLTVQKIINDFESRVLDGYRKIYFELVTLNESFSEKIKGLDAENRAILEKVEILDDKKNALVDRLRKLNDGMCEALSKIKVDGSGVKDLAEKINNAIDGIEFKKYDKHSKILKMQREILKKMIV